MPAARFGWLSSGEILKRMWDLEEKILMSLDRNDKDVMFPQLKDENWKTDLAFLVDVFEHLNNLNVILQGSDL
jgi:hypothetical protein